MLVALRKSYGNHWMCVERDDGIDGNATDANFSLLSSREWNCGVKPLNYR